MDATKWTQGFQEMINVKPMEQIMIPTNPTQPICTANSRAPSNNMIINNSNNSNNNNNNNMLERKPRPQEKINCPRCNSTNTKFCYYNNYSLTQPRYFCKGCRRYWTEGGSLRNVPVGGSSRKNKRPSSAILPSTSSTPASSLSSSSSLGLASKLPDLNPPILFPDQQNSKTQKGSPQDLNLFSFPVMQDGHHHHHTNVSQFLQMPKMENNISQPNPTACSSSPLYVSSSPISALELLRTGVSSRGLNAFMPGPMVDSNGAVLYSSGFSLMPDYKTTNLSFSTDHHHQGLVNNNSNNNNDNNRSAANNDHINGGRVLFPFSEMKELSGTTQEVGDHQQQKSQGNAYWSGMFSTTGGPSW